MSFYDIKITGKDVKRFIHNLHKMHIKFLNIEFDNNSVIIKVSAEDYKKIKNIKTIYQIEIIKLYGIEKVKHFFKKYYIFLITLLLGFLIFIGLTNIIFEVEVIHNNKELREMLLEELKIEGISKYHLVVSYDKKEKIKDNILKKYKDTIEWLEIERQGTRYEIKVEERKKKEESKDEIPRDIIARKNGLIYKINSSQGEILVKKDQYVKKGEILISGTIHNKEDIVGYVQSEGNALAETWYTVTVELPYHYHEEKILNKKQKLLEIKWFNKSNKYFNFSHYKNSNIKTLYQLKNNILPISVSIIEEQAKEVIDKVYTKDNAVIEASKIAKDKLFTNLGKDIEILYEKNLKIVEENSKIEVVIFYKVLEDITSYQNVIIENQKEEEENGN